jgi:hypothetical protein
MRWAAILRVVTRSPLASRLGEIEIRSVRGVPTAPP